MLEEPLGEVEDIPLRLHNTSGGILLSLGSQRIP
jgi:hypothetical protein